MATRRQHRKIDTYLLGKLMGWVEKKVQARNGGGLEKNHGDVT